MNEEMINVCGVDLAWRKNTIAIKHFVVHELVDHDGDVFGSGILKDEALRDARYRLLTAPRDTPLSLDEFRSVALIIPVIPGRTGVRYERANRFLLDESNINSTTPLFREALRVYDVTPQESRPDDREKFPMQFIDALLGSCSEPGATSIHLQVGPNIRPIVFVNQRSIAATMSVDSIMQAAYDIMYEDMPSAPAPR
ncbi:MAG: hypothetical protein Q8O64_05745 [Sideroxyarcus sp.]|nr:hypothetical protein [Sideroxyarcus sp.]